MLDPHLEFCPAAHLKKVSKKFMLIALLHHYPPLTKCYIQDVDSTGSAWLLSSAFLLFPKTVAFMHLILQV